MIDSTISLPVSTDYIVLTVGKLQISDSGLREERGLRVFEGRVLRRTLGLRERMQQEVETVPCKELQN
jgi:hypothetical protein